MDDVDDVIEVAYETALAACRQATEAILPFWSNPSNRAFDRAQALQRTSKDGVANFATVADHLSEQVIIETIQSVPALAAHSIQCEESGQISGDPEWRWIVDPIDGTLNFINGIPDFGICVALFHGDEPVVGVIAIPALRQFVAVRRGGQPMLLSYDGSAVADLRDLASHYGEMLESSVVGYNLGYHDRERQLAFIGSKLIASVGYASCLGSFAVGNFRLVQGMMGAYFGTAPTVMDIAPAALLIPSIGGVVSDLDGNAINWRADIGTYVAAVSARVHEQLLHALHS